MRKIRFTTVIFLGAILAMGFTKLENLPWHSKFVHESNGRLVYTPDSRGDQIPDFGKVGYHKGASELPDVAVVKTISAPQSGDAEDLIQKAIDEVAKMPMKISGFRGAILLKRGIYRIPGKINIRDSGILLRGEGTEESGTILVATGKGQRSLLTVSGEKSTIERKETRVAIAESYVPAGSSTFLLESTRGFKVGDAIIVLRPGTDQWIHDLKMDQIVERPGTKQWKAREYDLKFERVITAIEGNRIHIDQPVVMGMDKLYGGGSVYQITDVRISEIGIENILFKSDFTSETDEDHGWYAIQFQNCREGWVRNVVSKYFGNGCVNMAGGSKYITVTDSKCLEAKSVITGGRRYSFSINGQMCLVMNCETTEGRHDYVTGARVCGPNVFYNCKAGNTHADIGPHHRWSVGTLYDHITTDGEINIQDRGNYGSGHGWAGVTQVVWNCKVKTATVQNPWVSAKNYCIGLTGDKDPGRFKDRPDGEWEGINQSGLQPSSLYLSQKKQSNK